MKIQFHPLARAEMHRAAEWYERRRRGHGDRFYTRLEACLFTMRSFPDAQTDIGRGYRRALLKSFPYGLIYRQLEPDILVIVAVAHTRRKPGYWRRRRV